MLYDSSREVLLARARDLAGGPGPGEPGRRRDAALPGPALCYIICYDIILYYIILFCILLMPYYISIMLIIYFVISYYITLYYIMLYYIIYYIIL